MRRAKTKKVWVLFGAALIVAFGLVLAFRTGVHHDPAGISRRPPYSMHAHQSEWTLKSHPGKSPLQSPISLNTTKLATHRESPLQVQGTWIAKLSPGATRSRKALPDKRFQIGKFLRCFANTVELSQTGNFLIA